LLKGNSKKEFLISTYCCHPSLGNDNLSGMVLWALLLRELKGRELRYSYRFLIIPETIGAIAYLSKNEESAKKIEGGFVITSVAGPGKIGYKSSFSGKSLVDNAILNAFRYMGKKFIKYPFDIQGSDERQFSSNPFRIPMCSITKDKYYEYKYYHTSLDNLNFIKSKYLVGTLGIYVNAIENLEKNIVYEPVVKACEPMLGKRGAYPKIGGSINQNKPKDLENKKSILDTMKWLLFYCDGTKSLFEISEITSIPITELEHAGKKLIEISLLKEKECIKKNVLKVEKK